MPSADVLIVGAGIVGAACAAELAARGAEVAVLERDVVGSGATAAGMGHLVVIDDSPAQLALTRHSQRLWDAMVEADPSQHDHLRCGTIWVAADAEELAAIGPKQALYAANGIASQPLDERALYDLEPKLRPGLAGGLLVPGDSVVYPPRTALALMDRAAAAGARLLHGEAAALLPDGVRLADGSAIRAGLVVVATGARCPALLPEVPIRPKKGHLAITDRYPGFVRHQLVELGYIKNAHAADGDTVSFNVQPRPSGQILIGSSRQPGVGTSPIDYPMLARMVARAVAFMPALAGCAMVRTWTGLRAATPDGLPLIGPHPARPGVWLATGHEGLGITTALGTAQLLAAQLLGQPAPIPPEPYLPQRLPELVAVA